MAQSQNFEKNFERLHGRIRGASTGGRSTETDDREQKIQAAIASGTVVKLSPTEIHTDENSRFSFDLTSNDFLELAASIERYGILQNLVVAYRRESKTYRLVCIAGHRRLAAVQHLGLDTKVPCRIVSESDFKSTKGIALVENLKREDLHFLDVAEGYKDLVAKGEMTVDDLALCFDRHKKTISRYIKVADWPAEAKDLVRLNPRVFTSKVLIQQFANKRFSSEAELVEALKEKITGKKPEFKSPTHQSLDAKLNCYFETKQNLTTEVRSAIVDFLKFAGLTPKGYRYPFGDDSDQ